MEYMPKDYYDIGRTLCSSRDLTSEQMVSLRNGEIFTLMKEGIPVKRILMDSYNVIREGDLETSLLARAFFGIPDRRWGYFDKEQG
jgi:hypothetical protein